MISLRRLLPSRRASILLLFILAVIFVIPSTEGQAAVRGQVFARDYLRNLVPAGFAVIMVRGESFETTIRTDSEGYYLAYLPAGTYEMTAILSTVTLDYIQTKTVALWYTSDTVVNFYLEPMVPSRSSTAKVAITIDGVRPEYHVNLLLDDSSAGSILGGGTLTVEVNSRSSHTFTVEPYVGGSEGERFYCKANSWALEASSQQLTATHTFEYTTQYLLSVSTPHGDATKNSGWYSRGSSISLSTPETAEISQGARDTFDAWTISGSRIKDSTVSINLESPLKAAAEYRREYYLELVSLYGRPSGGGWYEQGTSAKIHVENEMSLPGLIGALGGKRVFTGWTGGIVANSNIAYVQMETSKTVIANWREDNSIPYIVILLLVLTIMAATVLLLRGNVAGSQPNASGGIPEQSNRASQ